MKLLPDEKSHGLGAQRESGKKNGLLCIFFRRFWVKEPRHSENDSGEKCYQVSIVTRDKNDNY